MKKMLFQNGMLTALVLSAFSIPEAKAAETYTCVKNPNISYCSDMGFTMSEADCDGKTMLKCPFDKSKVYCSTICDNRYEYSCSGTGYSGGSGAACRGKYMSCTCASGYKWNGSACIEDTCPSGYEIATSNNKTSWQTSYSTTTLTNGKTCYKLSCKQLSVQTITSGVISCICPAGTIYNGYEVKEIAGTCGYSHVIYTNCNNSGDSADSYIGMDPSAEVRAKYPGVVKVSFKSGYTGDTTAPCYSAGLTTMSRPDVKRSDGSHKGVCFICK